jgi:hypothetical protein
MVDMMALNQSPFYLLVYSVPSSLAVRHQPFPKQVLLVKVITPVTTGQEGRRKLNSFMEM